MIAKFLRWKHNGTPAGNGWNRSTNNAAWGVDYFNRTGTARSNIYDNKVDETRYYYTDHDTSGAQLNGTASYEVTFAAGQEPPVSLLRRGRPSPRRVHGGPLRARPRRGLPRGAEEDRPCVARGRARRGQPASSATCA